MGSGFQDLKQQAGSELNGMRLDQAAAALFAISRRRARKAIDDGGLYLNRKRCRTAGRKVATGDRLRLVMLEDEKLTPFEPQQLIWQQPPLYVIAKRDGQYSQEALHRSLGTLPDELQRHLQLAPGSDLRPVHRLDRGTSGIMLFCSHAATLQQIQKQWHSCATKRYMAVVEPAPTWDEQRITLAIDPVRDARGCFHVAESGRACDSEARVIERRGKRALLELIPHSGRTHQLRVHLSSLGCPILGDTRYGGAAHPRMMLHAYSLQLSSPALQSTMEWKIDPEENWQW